MKKSPSAALIERFEALTLLITAIGHEKRRALSVDIQLLKILPQTSSHGKTGPDTPAKIQDRIMIRHEYKQFENWAEISRTFVEFNRLVNKDRVSCS